VAEPTPLLVFSDDWGRHPSSCQHLTRRMLGRFGVTWVNTIGTRTPRLDLDTLKRGLEKLRHWSRPRPARDPLPEHLRVVNPWMWVSFRSSLARWVNRQLLVGQLAPLCRAMPEPPIAITTLPIVADLVGRLPVRRWVYYCVDDFGQWPGLDQGPLRRMDDELIDKADVLVAVSETLRERIRGRGREAHLLTHGVDLDFWQGETVTAGATTPADGLEGPVVVYWGVVDRRMDVGFIRRLAADMTAGTILLVGPLADPDPDLLRLPRVVYHPPVAFEQLPVLARRAAVLLMPYADLPVTRAIQPLKMKEYLATGRPVVARELPATRPWADCLDLAEDAGTFSRLVRERIATGVPDGQVAARSRLDGEGWAAKAEQLARWALADQPETSGVNPPAVFASAPSHP
jgi:glycosyltransferase involved in cell wall biosynthesis